MHEIIIKNTLGDSFTVLPDLGATISSLIIDNQEVIKHPVNSDDLKKGYPSALLFPFPNRVRDGKYTFEGTDYQLDRNDTGRGHAIHGFVAHKPFEVIEQKNHSVTLAHTYDGGVHGYPFPFTLEVKYSFPRTHEFRLTYRILNIGKTSMPCGFGWHPYFYLGDTKIGDLTLSVPSHFAIEVDDSIVPFQASEYNENEMKEAAEISLKNTILDNVYRIAAEEKTATIVLSSEKQKLEISQSVGRNKLNYFVLYTPPIRNCIAIEPQTCNINAFNNGEGLITLAPNQSSLGQIDIKLTNK